MVDFNGKYAFMTSYLKSEEARLVTPAHLDRLLRARDASEAIEIIKDTDIGHYLDSVLVTTFDEADRNLWFYLDDCLKRIQRYDQTPGEMQKLIDAYMVKYDVLNVKAALESVSTGKKASLIPLGTIYRYDWLADLGKVQDVNEIGKILENCGLNDYAAIVRTYPVTGKTYERLNIESALDRQYYADLLKSSRGMSDRAELIKAFGTMMDIRNLKILMRGAARDRAEEAVAATVGAGYLISQEDIARLAATRLEDFPGAVPFAYQKLTQEVVTSYGKNRNVTAIGEITDRYEYITLREMLSLKLMSPVMIVWYLVLKETEVRNLRIVLRALFDSISLDEIKDYLVMTV